MRGALLPVHELDDGTLAAWRELAATALEPNPFFAPEMASAAARHLPLGREADLLLAVHDGDRLALALPVRRVARYRRAPIPTIVSWGHAHSFLDTPLVAPSDPARAFETALDVLRAAGAGWLTLEQLPTDGPVRRALDAALEARRISPVPLLEHERPVVRRRAEPSYLDGRLSARRRKRLRSQRRGLEAALGGTASTRDLARIAFQPALEEFLALEQAGWKGRAGTALSSDRAAADFFCQAMTAFAGERRLQLWALQVGEVTVASVCAVVAGDGVFHLKTAYDERHAAHSPGLQLEIDLIRAFHDDPALAWLDSCTAGGSSPSALLYPDRRVVQTLLVPLGGARARLAGRSLERAMRWRSWVRDRASPGGDSSVPPSAPPS